MKYVLLLVMLDTWGGGGLSAEFNTHKACIDAAQGLVMGNMSEIHDRSKELMHDRPQLGGFKHRWVCMPKG